MMKKNILIVLILINTISLFAGKYAGDFMSIGSGVKALSMGGAYAAVADEGSAIYWNGSGIGQIRNKEFSLMRAFLYDGLATYDHFTYCHPLPNEVTIGVNWTRLSIDRIPEFDESHIIGNVDQRSAYEELHLSADPDGYFKSTDDLFQFTFAKHIHQDADLGWFLFVLPIDYYMGMNFKYIKRQMMENTGDGTGFDMSFMFKTNLGMLIDQEWLGDISTGVNLQDVGGTEISWDTQSKHQDEVLFNTKFGFAFKQPIKKYNSELLLAYDKDFVYDKTDHFGVELKIKDKTKVRMGFYDGNFSTGVGLKIYNVNLDYALITNNIGLTNRVGISLKL